MGGFHHVTPDRQTPRMATDDDLHAAIDAATKSIWTMLWDVAPSRRERVAEAAVRAAAPFLDGSEKRRVEAEDAGGTVTP